MDTTPPSPASSTTTAPSDAPVRRRYICTWLYADTPTEELRHYQIKGKSSSQSFQDVYWRCVAVFFATCDRFAPDARTLLFTNSTPPESVNGIPLAKLLDDLGVTVVNLPMTFQTPPGYYHQWRNQFYTFDILKYLGAELEDHDTAIVLDSDCLWVGDPDGLWETIDREGLLTYAIGYANDWVNNGLSRRAMTSIGSELLGREIPLPLIYCGGEIQVGRGSDLKRLAGELDGVWAQLMERFSNDQPVFFEEGQTLSYLYYKTGVPLGTANPFIRRIFTDALWGENNTTMHDNGLTIWHVPLEKRLGLARVFESLRSPQSPLRTLPPDALRAYLGRALGIPAASPEKRVRDFAVRLKDKLRR